MFQKVIQRWYHPPYGENDDWLHWVKNLKTILLTGIVINSVSALLFSDSFDILKVNRSVKEEGVDL